MLTGVISGEGLTKGCLVSGSLRLLRGASFPVVVQSPKENRNSCGQSRSLPRAPGFAPNPLEVVDLAEASGGWCSFVLAYLAPDQVQRWAKELAPNAWLCLVETRHDQGLPF